MFDGYQNDLEIIAVRKAYGDFEAVKGISFKVIEGAVNQRHTTPSGAG